MNKSMSEKTFRGYHSSEPFRIIKLSTKNVAVLSPTRTTSHHIFSSKSEITAMYLYVVKDRMRSEVIFTNIPDS